MLRTVFVVLLAAVLLVWGGGAVRGQENTKTVYIELSTARPGDTYDESIRAQLEARLEAAGINPVFVTPENFDQYPLFWEQPSFNAVYSGILDTGAVWFTPYNTKPIALSPVLEGAFSVMAIMPLEDDTVLEHALTLAEAFAHYTLDNCAEAEPLFELLLQDTALLESVAYLRPSLEFYLANCRLLANDFSSAARFYESALAYPNGSDQFLWSAAVNLSWLWLQSGRDDEAFTLMERMVQALEAEDDYWVVYALSSRSQLYALDAQFDPAIADMDRAVEVCLAEQTAASICASLYAERGQRIMLIYEWDRALADYNRALELDPAYADAHYYRGVLHYTVLEREQAVADFQRYLELAPNGLHAEDAAQYIQDLNVQIEALN